MADTGSVKRSCKIERKVPSSEEEDDGGFLFCRRSKRIRKQKEAPEKEIEVPKSIMRVTKETESKQRRRSAFMRGRKLPSLELSVTETENKPSSNLENEENLAAIAELYKEIPAGLNSDERLLLIFDKSLQLMSDRLKKRHNVNIPNFSKEAEELVSHLRETLYSTDLAKKVNIQKEEKNERIVIPNPKNKQLEEYAEKSEQVKHRMLREDKEWEDLLHKYQDNSMVSAPRNMEETNNNNGVELECLSTEQKEFLSSAPNLIEIMERLNTLKSQSYLMIDKVCKTASTLKNFSDVTENDIDESTKSLGSVSSEGVCGTPRQLIKGVVGNHKNPLI